MFVNLKKGKQANIQFHWMCSIHPIAYNVLQAEPIADCTVSCRCIVSPSLLCTSLLAAALLLSNDIFIEYTHCTTYIFIHIYICERRNDEVMILHAQAGRQASKQTSDQPQWDLCFVCSIPVFCFSFILLWFCVRCMIHRIFIYSHIRVEYITHVPVRVYVCIGTSFGHTHSHTVWSGT